jgi:DNA-binding response OmpR family regulator
MKILLIEDSVSMGKAIKALLETQGHVVQWIVGLAQRLGGF